MQYTQAIGLVTAPDYDTLIAQGYDIAQDPLWNYQPQLHRPVIEQIAYYHCDQLGTPQELTDRDGQLLWSTQYKAWGEAKVQRSERAKYLRIDNHHRYQGQYYDAETGLHYNRFRYYDPHLARYISRDPIGLNGGMNLNAYVPNPNQWVDPAWLQRQKVSKEELDRINRLSAHLNDRDRPIQRNITIINAADAQRLENRSMVSNNSSSTQAKPLVDKGLEAGQRLANVRSPASRASAMVKCAAGKCDPIGPDYISCSATVPGIQTPANFAISLHNGDIYAGSALNKDQIKTVYLRSVKGEGGFSLKGGVGCALFKIQNVPTYMDRERATHESLNGLGISASAAAGPFLFAADKPIMFVEDAKTKKLILSTNEDQKMYAVGFGAHLGGGADVSYGKMSKIGNVKDILSMPSNIKEYPANYTGPTTSLPDVNGAYQKLFNGF